METINVYLASELKESFPEGFESAHKSWQEDHATDIFWQDEIIECMKEIFKVSGVTLQNYSIGGQGTFLTCSIPTYWNELAECDMIVDDYTGQKAYTWIKENLLNGAKFKRVNYTYENESGRKVKSWRYDITKKDGESWSCEFTGICYDHDFIESLLDDIKSGCTLHEAFCNLANKADKLIEDEAESQMTESYFITHADANDYKYTESGNRI